MTEQNKPKDKSLRELILGIDDAAATPIVVSEWGGVTVYAKAMDGREFAAWLKESTQSTERDDDDLHMTIWIITRYITDEHGVPLFAETDREELLKKRGHVLNRLSAAVINHSGLSASAKAAIEKNFGNGQKSDTSTS